MDNEWNALLPVLKDRFLTNSVALPAAALGAGASSDSSIASASSSFGVLNSDVPFSIPERGSQSSPNTYQCIRYIIRYLLHQLVPS